MTKITLNNVGSLIDATTAQSVINNNFDTIEQAFDNTLSRDGTSPNQMGSTLDMNSNAIINLPQPLSVGSPLRLEDLSEFLDTGSISTIPAGGLTGQTLTKDSNADYDVSWTNAGQGTVQSVGLAAPSDFDVTGSPVTTNGTLTLAWDLAPTGTGAIVRQTNPTIVGTIPTLTAGTVQTNANLTGPITSVGNATSIASQTGTGTTFVMQNNPALITPALGTPGSGVLTNCTGYAVTNLNPIADFSFVGNNTGSSAAPTAIQIPSLTTKVTPAAGDYVLLSDQAASGAFKKATVSSLSTSAGVSSIDALTGAFTTSNGLTSTGNSLQLTAARRTLPTTQVFTSGSGTYTTPANCLWIEVELVGGGGGGAGSGTTPGNGGTGGNTTFSTLTGNGGVGAVGAAGGAGGTASGGYLNKTGGAGGNGSGLNVTAGGFGANSPYGSAGVGGAAGAGAGVAAAANSGSGGGGGGVNTTVNGGGGGGSGGFVRAIINSPASSYSYAVGAAGTAGTAGTGGAAGGAGGSGLIIVKEHYGS